MTRPYTLPEMLPGESNADWCKRAARERLAEALAWLRRRRIARLVACLSHPAQGVQDKAIGRLRGYLRRGRVSITTDVIMALDVAMQDEREWVRWNAASVLIDLGSREERRAPPCVRSAIVDEDGDVRLDAVWWANRGFSADSGALEGDGPLS